MPTINMPVGPVSLRIVKPTSFLCVRVRLGRFASRPARRPGAVVRLKMQAVIGGPDRQLHQAVRLLFWLQAHDRLTRLWAMCGRLQVGKDFWDAAAKGTPEFAFSNIDEVGGSAASANDQQPLKMIDFRIRPIRARILDFHRVAFHTDQLLVLQASSSLMISRARSCAYVCEGEAHGRLVGRRRQGDSRVCF
jgi:hypothetical protein